MPSDDVTLKAYYKVDKKSRNPMNPKNMFLRPNSNINDKEKYYRDIYVLSSLDEIFLYSESIKIFEVNYMSYTFKRETRSTAFGSSARFGTSFRYGTNPVRFGTSFGCDLK